MIVYVDDDSGATYQVRFDGVTTVRALDVQRVDTHGPGPAPLKLDGLKARQLIARARLQVAKKGSNL